MAATASLWDLCVCVRGGGDIASGVCWRLHRCGFRVIITEIPRPLAVRRAVSFCEAVYDGRARVEGVEAVRIDFPEEAGAAWAQGNLPLIVDPSCECRKTLRPEVIVDAILAKRNVGTALSDAPLVIGLGPGFEVGRDAHFVVETNRGHHLGRLLTKGSAEADTGVPGPVLGITVDRVLRAPASGTWQASRDIGDLVAAGDEIGSVAAHPVRAAIGGVLRGVIRPNTPVTRGLKVGDIDPRGRKENCHIISEKALAIAGGVIEGILITYGGSGRTAAPS